MAHDGIRDTIHTDDHPGDGVSRGTARMEAFADAVFAISFTLPVTEIALPGRGPLLPQLASMWPSYAGYLLAVLVIGTFWSHHHFTGAIYRTTGHWFNLATVLFLATIGFVAYPCRLFAASLPDPATRGDGALVLVCTLALTGALWLFKWEVGRGTGHVDDRLQSDYVTRLSRMYRFTLVAYLIAIGLCLVWWPAGLIVCGAITAHYLVPPATPVYRTEAPRVEGDG